MLHIYTAIATKIERGEVANPVTLSGSFEARYLAQLAAAGCFDAVGAEDYARAVVALAHEREADALWEDYRAERRHEGPGFGTSDRLAYMHSRLEEILHDGPELQPINLASWTGRPMPQREWIVADWIPLRRATGLYGAPGAGKSLLMQMLCTAAALDAKWLGLPVRKCRSVLLYCEDDEEEMVYRQAPGEALRAAS